MGPGRLTYRPVTCETVDDLHALVQHDHARRYLLDGALFPREWTVDRVRDSLDLFERRGVGLWLAHDRTTGDLVGFCGFLEILSMHPDPQLVYTMSSDSPADGTARRWAARRSRRRAGTLASPPSSPASTR